MIEKENDIVDNQFFDHTYFDLAASIHLPFSRSTVIHFVPMTVNKNKNKKDQNKVRMCAVKTKWRKWISI
jgi:hypothetical protein